MSPNDPIVNQIMICHVSKARKLEMYKDEVRFGGIGR
jgi:hypothetical protein